MSDDLVNRLQQDCEMLKDGHQTNLTKLWHSEVVRDAAKDCKEAASEIERLRASLPALEEQNAALVKALEEARGFLDPDLPPSRLTNREIVARINAALSYRSAKP